ncbi:MAG: PKD domain-containing protein [Chitinophagales bacterium]
MKSKLRYGLVTLLSGFFYFIASAQEQNPYIINGNAFQENCNCYTLTKDLNNQAGSVWNKNKIDLRQSFDYKFNVYLGCKDASGADGIVFVLQPVGTSIGSSGQGLGFEGVSPSIGIPLDTWQNLDFNDPAYDHIGIYKNGDLVNGTPNTLAGPVPALNNSANIEDCQWHTFRIIWDAPTTTLSAEIDGVPRVQTKTDLVKDIFLNNPELYWGFSAATGGESNLQKFCTSLNPGYSLPSGQKTCAPATLSFHDSSTSFGSILKWSWDFGDGTYYDGQTPPPHAYSIPGYYTVKLNILGNNGCLSDTIKNQITIGSKPVPGFTSNPKVICAGAPVILQDASQVQFGTITEWNWNFNNGEALAQTTDSSLTKSFPAGLQQIQLISTTREGCVSDPYNQTLNVTEKPLTAITAENACFGDPVHLNAENSDPAVPIRQWYWLTGDGGFDSSAHIIHDYSAGGRYPVRAYAENFAGCSSDTITTTVIIYQTNARLGNDTVAVIGQPFQLHATGGDFYQWTPATGLNDPSSPDPQATLYNDIRYIVMAYTSFGCPTSDTILIKAYKGPAIYVPNAFTPDNNGHNDYFRPIAVGITNISFFNIYNRSGQLVYSSHNTSLGWDGTSQGKPQPEGTYVWVIKGEDYLGKTHAEKGTVVLIR